MPSGELGPRIQACGEVVDNPTAPAPGGRRLTMLNVPLHGAACEAAAFRSGSPLAAETRKLNAQTLQGNRSR